MRECSLLQDFLFEGPSKKKQAVLLGCCYEWIQPLGGNNALAFPPFSPGAIVLKVCS